MPKRAAQQRATTTPDRRTANTRQKRGRTRQPRILRLAQITEQVLLTPRSDVDRLKLTINTVLQPAPVEGNARLLERLVNNLVENAIHHNTPGGHVEITTGTRHQHPFLTITNTGPVIPPTELQRLFQPFQRLNGARTHHRNGHGLGLSIVQAIATAHDATITTHPQRHGGLSIQIGFPRPDAPHAHTATNEPQAKQTNDPQTTKASTLTAKPG